MIFYTQNRVCKFRVQKKKLKESGKAFNLSF